MGDRGERGGGAQRKCLVSSTSSRGTISRIACKVPARAKARPQVRIQARLRLRVTEEGEGGGLRR